MRGADRAVDVGLNQVNHFSQEKVRLVCGYARASEYEACLSVAMLLRTFQSFMITSVSDSDIVTTLHCRSAWNLSVWVRLAFKLQLYKNLHLSSSR